MGLRTALDALDCPVACVDFEFGTVHAIPRYAALRPCDRVPCQCSMHVPPAPGASLAALPAMGSVVAQSVGAERSVLTTCGRSLGAPFEASSAALSARLVDTRTLAQSGYCHPAQHGSYSIKKLAPALLGRGYEDLAVQDGMSAVRAWRALVAGEDPDPEGTAWRLREYCGRDTQLMHDIVEALRALAGGARP